MITKWSSCEGAKWSQRGMSVWGWTICAFWADGMNKASGKDVQWEREGQRAGECELWVYFHDVFTGPVISQLTTDCTATHLWPHCFLFSMSNFFHFQYVSFYLGNTLTSNDTSQKYTKPNNAAQIITGQCEQDDRLWRDKYQFVTRGRGGGGGVTTSSCRTSCCWVQLWNKFVWDFVNVSEVKGKTRENDATGIEREP